MVIKKHHRFKPVFSKQLTLQSHRGKKKREKKQCLKQAETIQEVKTFKGGKSCPGSDASSNA